ncbi:DUF551 domain-containing protein [Raoultella planticola]|uniref:DUF551 domain-containing protein n=1 Tax=Raoultella planticola TaxID=575 RepID=UPI003D0516AC
MTRKLTSDERLVKILSETQATIMEHNSRCVRGSVEVDARLFESMIMELQERRKAAMDGEPVFTLEVSQADYKGQKLGNSFGFTTLDAARELKEGKYQLYRHAQPAPVVPEGLNPETTDLVLRFASALADKLYKAEQKYGRSTDWMKDDWYDDCLQSLWEHIEKGDPRDVAAYCAFMWHHGWVTTDYDRNVQNACHAAILQAGNSPAHSGLRPEQIGVSPAQDHGWIPVSERMPDDEQEVIVQTHSGWRYVSFYDAHSRLFFDSPDGDIEHILVTHWMPLPADPQEVK